MRAYLQKHSMAMALAFIAGLVANLSVFGILNIIHDDRSSHRCQEVIVRVDLKSDIVARCPVGTYLDVLDDNVVCRCGDKTSNQNVVPTEPEPRNSLIEL